MPSATHRSGVWLSMGLALLFASPTAFAQEETTANILGRHIGAFTETVSNFGGIGTTLTHISSSTFGGTGSQRRDMARLVEKAFDPWRNASAATRDSLGLAVATRALTATDYATSVFAPGIDGDYRGAVSGAVQVAVAPTIITAGTAAFGTLGTGAGAFIGSVIPVVGTALGGVVGGAIGKVAGGYLSAFAYDKWIKGWIGVGIEAGIAGLLDRGDLQEAMRNRDQYYYDQSIPEMRVAWDEMRAKGIGFGNEQVELTGPEQTPYIVVSEDPPSPDETTVVPLPPPPFDASTDPLAGATTITLNLLDNRNPRNVVMRPWLACTVEDVHVECSSAIEGYDHTFSGELSGMTIAGRDHSTGELEFLGDGYAYDTSGQVTIDLAPDGKTTVSDSGYLTIVRQWGKTDWGEGWAYDVSRTGEWLPY